MRGKLSAALVQWEVDEGADKRKMLGEGGERVGGGGGGRKRKRSELLLQFLCLQD